MYEVPQADVHVAYRMRHLLVVKICYVINIKTCIQYIKLEIRRISIKLPIGKAP